MKTQTDRKKPVWEIIPEKMGLFTDDATKSPESHADF